MKYRINKAIYHLCFFDRVHKDVLGGMDFSVIYKGITQIYCLSDGEEKELLSIWNNEIFNEINSASVARFHIEVVKNIRVDPTLFGCGEKEKDALQSKLDALEYYEKLLSGGTDLISALERNVENKAVSVSFSMLYYLKFGSIPDRLTAQLRKNTVSKNLCDFDSLLLLLAADGNNREQYKNIIQKSSFNFYSNDYDRINQAYFREKGGVVSDSRKTG